MIQTLNTILAAIIFVQVLYLFTCGQPFMKKNAKHENTNFILYKLFYVVAASLAFGNAMLSDCQTLWISFIYLAVIAILQGRVFLAWKLYKKLK